ncbi:ACT domain protein [Caprobacter fermentans]|uniref:ACT domain protein n=1 Tax=Caproicibacter fermentans TaxID=2576756 RepID=A0A6N8HXX6_9FIRM|nr:ACT domain-containing protein [Caproicibacter fermentans]MVB10602.1 ACT domain protein [Caproicibacter fermentans]
MKLELIKGGFTVCRIQNIKDAFLSGDFVSVTVTRDEISLVCPTGNVPEHCVSREDGWACVKVLGPLNFSLIGILARISGILAKNEISIFAVSTFDTDYILMKDEKLNQAVAALRENGYEFSE